MHGPPIEPLDDDVTLAAVLRAAPPGEPCGVWLASARRGGRLPVMGDVGVAAGALLLVHGDLGALARRVPTVVVRFQGAVTAVPSTVLLLIRMLELLSAPAAGVEGVPLDEVPLGDDSPEAVLARRRADGRPVRGSRIVYRFPAPRAVDASAAPSLG